MKKISIYTHCTVQWNTINVLKAQIFWEGHKILRNLHLTFDSLALHSTKVRWRFRKILWPSQNIWNHISTIFFTWNFLTVFKKHFLSFKNKIDVAPIVKLAELKSFGKPYELFPEDINQFEFFLLIIFQKFIVKWNKE